MGQRRAVARLLATGAVLTGLFLMHGARLTAGGCHDAGGMAPLAAGMTVAAAPPELGHVAHLVPASSMPGAGGDARASCVSTAPRPVDAAVVGLLLTGVVAPRPGERGGRGVPAWREGRRRAPPRASALLVSLGVSRT